MAKTTAHVYNARLTGVSRAKKRRQERRAENGYDPTRHVEKDKALSRTNPAEKSQELYQQSFELFLEYVQKKLATPNAFLELLIHSYVDLWKTMAILGTQSLPV
jgi:hypothetical protein